MMTYTVDIFRHFADARQLAAALTEAGIASKIESISAITHIVFVRKCHGRRAEAIRRGA